MKITIKNPSPRLNMGNVETGQAYHVGDGTVFLRIQGDKSVQLCPAGSDLPLGNLSTYIDVTRVYDVEIILRPAPCNLNVEQSD